MEARAAYRKGQPPGLLRVAGTQSALFTFPVRVSAPTASASLFQISQHRMMPMSNVPVLTTI